MSLRCSIHILYTETMSMTQFKLSTHFLADAHAIDNVQLAGEVVPGNQYYNLYQRIASRLVDNVLLFPCY